MNRNAAEVEESTSSSGTFKTFILSIMHKIVPARNKSDKMQYQTGDVKGRVYIE